MSPLTAGDVVVGHVAVSDADPYELLYGCGSWIRKFPIRIQIPHTDPNSYLEVLHMDPREKVEILTFPHKI